MSNNVQYIWQSARWPDWSFDLAEISDTLNQVHYQQGLLLGRMRDLGMDVRQQAVLSALTEDVVKTSAIEGEQLNAQSVRSSLARRLGMDIGALAPVDRSVEGVVEMILDATGKFDQELTAERLFAWHAALFPTGYSGMSKINVARYRDDKLGAMQVVSGRMGREKVHYQAPPAERIEQEMNVFIDWLNTETPSDLFVKAAIAHLWFLTLHPFDDGNGRIARAIADRLLAKADKSAQRFYSLSAQVQYKRSEYYDILEQTQKGRLNTGQWIKWFLTTIAEAMQAAHSQLDGVLYKTGFWRKWADTSLNERQIKVLNRLLDGFDGRLNNRKWVAIAQCSRDTALRDITDLLHKGILTKAEGSGRSVHYDLADWA